MATAENKLRRSADPALMSTRTVSCRHAAFSCRCFSTASLVVCWLRGLAATLGPAHLPCPQIVEFPIIATDDGAQARCKRECCRPNRVRCITRIRPCGECSRALVPIKDWVPSTIARKEDLSIALVRADLDDLTCRSLGYMGPAAEQANAFGHSHGGAPFLQRNWSEVFIQISNRAADVKTVGHVATPSRIWRPKFLTDPQ